jgi:isopentenyl-diphosphate delta-isomerase
VLVTDYHGDMTINPKEIMDTRWIDLGQLQKELQEEPQKFSAWFLIAAPRVLKMYQ